MAEVILAEWFDGSTIIIGPFDTRAAAMNHGGDVLDEDDQCASWDVYPLTRALGATS